MYLSVHAPAGVLLAQSTDSAPLAFLLGVFSHFLLDIIPHGDTNIKWVKKNFWPRVAMLASMDLVIMIVVLYFLLTNISFNPLVTAAAIAGTVLPDAIWGLRLFMRNNNLLSWYQKTHSQLHHILPDVSAAKGFALQLIVLAGILLWNFTHF